jgi:hypothetical protein
MRKFKLLFKLLIDRTGTTRHKRTKDRISVIVAIFGVLVVAISMTVLLSPVVNQAQRRGRVGSLPKKFADKVPKQIKDQLTLYTGSSGLTAAKVLGVTQIMGKQLEKGGGSPGKAKTKKLNDVGIGVSDLDENEPTVVASPKDKKKLVAGSHLVTFSLISCVAYTSADRGTTWTAPVAMAQLTATSFCSDPVLAYAPNGNRVYFAYMDVKQDFTEFPLPTLTIDYDILVSFSDNDGASWTGPVVALDGEPTIFVFDPDTGEIVSFTPGFVYDKPWIGTHVDRSQNDRAYVSATRIDILDPIFPGDCHIAFAGSDALGVSGSWNSPTLLDSSSGGCGIPFLVSGSRPKGGLGGDVVVAWYNSGSDGFLNGSFEIRTRRSPDHGATWDSTFVASFDSFEVPAFLGPNFFYHRWSGTMFPDLEIDSKGGAHIVYTHDPDPNFASPEDGDIRYISSPGPPYASWSPPVTVNDDGLERAQGYAALNIRGGGELHVIWEDHRLSPSLPTSTPEDCFFNGICNSPNLFYDIFSSTKKGASWSRNFRVSDASSISEGGPFAGFIGDYIDLAANDTTLFGIWTDRRHQTSVFALEDNVFGSRIIAGGGAP